MRILQYFIFYMCGFYMCLFYVSCSNVVYKEVYVPTKCDIEMPDKPPYYEPQTLNDFTQLLASELKYSEMLENSLNFCIFGDESESDKK